MSLVNTLLVAASLAVDSCVVALARGLAERKPKARDALVIGVAFGAAQGVMPVAGALAGNATSQWLARVDHWVAFGVLAALGVKSLLDSLRNEPRQVGGSGPASLALAAFATSIDAAAAGFGFQLVDQPVAPLAWFAASITACGSAACFLGGQSLAAGHRRAGQVLGGLVLLAIAFNVLRQHWDHA